MSFPDRDWMRRYAEVVNGDPERDAISTFLSGDGADPVREDRDRERL